MSELISALIGALVGAVISSWMFVRHERRQLKFDTLRRFVAYRYDPTSPEFSGVLNEVLVMYADHPEVLTALKRVSASSTLETLTALFRAMAAAVGVKHANISDEQFTTVFNIPAHLRSRGTLPRGNS